MKHYMKTRAIKIFLGVLCASVVVVIQVAPSQAATFNRNNIISDADMTDYRRMSAVAIQSFLTSQGGILGSYRTTDLDGAERSASEILYNAAYRYRLNPQFLISHLQKESSLVTGSRTDLLDWAMGYGVCDSCSKSHPNVIKYKGFAKQIDASANAFRNGYLADLDSRNSTVSGWGVGVSKTTLDGIGITPQNKATAVLFTYTPWLGYHGGDSSIGGNSLFFDIIERFFPNRLSSTAVIEYPDSTLLQDAYTGTVYKIEGGRLRPFTSLTALIANYDLSRVLPVDTSILNRYEVGYPISMPKFIYVQVPSGGVYLIDNNHERRAIPTKEILRQLGISPEELIQISYDDANDIPEAPPISSAEYPAGALVQNRESGAVMYFDPQENLHPIWSRELIDNQFKGYTIIGESSELFSEHPIKAPVKFSDGTLLKYAYRDTIYVIDDGKKRPVVSGDVLEELGGYSNVVSTTAKEVLKLHDTGKKMNFGKTSNNKKSNKSKKSKQDSESKQATTKKSTTKQTTSK